MQTVILDTYCTTVVSWCVLHMPSIYNTCYRTLMLVNCDRDHWEFSSWHFWYMGHDSSTLSKMVQYLWSYIYSLSMIWRYYMNVMFIFLLSNQDLRECCCKSRSSLYRNTVDIQSYTPSTSSLYRLHFICNPLLAITKWSDTRRNGIEPDSLLRSMIGMCVRKSRFTLVLHSRE